MTDAPLAPVTPSGPWHEDRLTPELLAPAGARPALEAAIRAGADAVYLGAAQFSARARATNFNAQDLIDAIDWAHAHGVRVHLALNTLLTDDEGPEALRLARQAYAAGVDALIVQDIGLAARLRQVLPQLPLHASTQMTVASDDGLRWLASLGFSRVILARELSLKDVRRLSRLAAELRLETEIFVHGALCTSYSGQCFLSQLQGGRSGNRGDCAQPCRLRYRLTDAVDGRIVTPPGSVPVSVKPSGQQDDKTSLFPWISPRDQGLWLHLDAIRDAGVTSLKIEGRMRDPDYVETVTSIYRDLLDQAVDRRDPAVRRELETRLLLAFNRGGALTDRHLTDDRRQTIRSGAISGRHGLRLGTVSRIQAERGQLVISDLTDLARQRPPQAGDLILIRRDGQDEAIASAPLGRLEAQAGQLTLFAFHPQVLRGLRDGDAVYQLSDSRGVPARPERGRVQLSATLRVTADQTIELTLTVLNRRSQGLSLTVATASDDRQPLTEDRLRQQLSRTGATPFQMQVIHIEGSIPLAISSVNALRRRALDELTAAMQQQGRQPAAPHGKLEDWPLRLDEQPAPQRPASASPLISAYFWQLPDDLATLPCGADRYVLPLLALDSDTARQAVAVIEQEAPDHRCWVWLPAAARGRQAQTLDTLLPQLAEWGIEGVYIGKGSFRALDGLAGVKRAVDWGAHVYNQNALAWLASQQPAAIAPSTELDPSQAGRLVRSRSPQIRNVPLEWPVYGRLRAMTIAICPIGEQEPGCRRCARSPGPTADRAASGRPDQARLYHLSQSDGQSDKPALRLLPHPRGCSAELFSRQLFMADTESLRTLAAPATGMIARLTFLEETPAERRQLIAALRAQLAAPVSDGADPVSGPTTADWPRLGEQIARRLASPLENRSLFDV